MLQAAYEPVPVNGSNSNQSCLRQANFSPITYVYNSRQRAKQWQDIRVSRCWRNQIPFYSACLAGKEMMTLETYTRYTVR